ncbi:MAG: linalool dehydratase/isomerase domain-containing protein, partial [Planctomycetota bacterium]
MIKGKKVLLKSSIAGLFIFCAVLLIFFVFLVNPCNAYGNNDFSKIDSRTQKLANRYYEIWITPKLRKRCLTQLHQQNPEWDFMFRTYSVLSFSNLALHDPQKKQGYLNIIDSIVEDTLSLEHKYGFKYFLLGYGQGNRWKIRPARSLFIDGEIALMLGARCLVESNKAYEKELSRRVEIIIDSMNKSTDLCAESYPDECWVFCNTIALAAIKISDQLNETDHSGFISQWITNAKKQLIDKKTGLLRSAFTLDGTPTSSAKGPEGSSIWMSCHMLQLIDKEFAQDQYKKAKKELLGSILGFGYSREWPVSYQGAADIDSGPVVPFLNASPSASGLAIM